MIYLVKNAKFDAKAFNLQVSLWVDVYVECNE